MARVSVDRVRLWNKQTRVVANVTISASLAPRSFKKSAPGCRMQNRLTELYLGSFSERSKRATSLNIRLPNSPKMINIPVLPDKRCKSCRTSCDSLRTAHNGSAWLCTQSRASQSLDTRAGMQGNFAQFCLFLVGFVFFWRDLLPSLRKYLVI